MSESIKIGIFADCITNQTPTLPDAKRGAYSPTLVQATDEQLKANLVWWRCSFCDGYVLLDAYRRTRERCQCGAVRCHRGGSEGWQRDGEVWIYI